MVVCPRTKTAFFAACDHSGTPEGPDAWSAFFPDPENPDLGSRGGHWFIDVCKGCDNWDYTWEEAKDRIVSQTSERKALPSDDPLHIAKTVFAINWVRHSLSFSLFFSLCLPSN